MRPIEATKLSQMRTLITRAAPIAMAEAVRDSSQSVRIERGDRAADYLLVLNVRIKGGA
jgi:hypothetical protein